MRTHRTESWTDQAKEHARDEVRELDDFIIQALIADGEASDDINNAYPDGDSLHHEMAVDHDYSLKDAAELLDELHQHEETDSGLWHGQEPRRAISTQAAYTMGNAVAAYWSELISTINDAWTGVLDQVEDNAEFYALLMTVQDDVNDKAALAALSDWLEDRGHPSPKRVIAEALADL